MIKVAISNNPNYLVNAETSDGFVQLPYTELQYFLPGLDVESVEHVNVRVEDDFVVGVVSVAQGQGGLIFVWDPVRDELIHISEGAYALTAVIKDNQIISLHDVSSWGVPEHLELKYITFGIKDTTIESKSYPQPIPAFSSEYDGNPDNIDLILKESRIYMKLNDEIFPVDN